MKKVISILILILSLSCKSQSTISLEQAYEYSKSDDGLPETVTYVKDVNNRLDQFVGTWKGTYGDKQYEFRFIKKLNFGSYTVKWDELIGRFSVKSFNGTVLYSSLNEINDENTHFRGINIQNKTYMLNFFGTVNYCNDSGVVFIEISKNNPNTMYLSFDRDKEAYDPSKCPNYSEFVPLLPKDKMTLIKQ
ncbi:DUF6705 family protein [Chryseobacterium cheonjiense]|uniref:DUF6705 domain-containing protein n=1 Tax=Chryseobacterium cheonjiense TaxID=2728845 RepID=A0A7Y0A8J6_9FLAO|nr:DUF6705 family protein [Chryseobacterium cheonjiense]NML58640.1 hypothetical protein [Chryseobacterium cheonjiense]